MQERVVVITGASAGIGAELAEVVAQRGARVALLARREDALAAVARKVEAAGAPALVLPTDVTDRAAVERAVGTTLERFGQIDVCVSNAGRGITRPPSELTDADLDEMMLVNVKSVLYCVQAVLPHFRGRGQGQFIHVSSLLGRVPFVPARAAYSAAKHALNALTASLRGELAASAPGIVVTSVHPGVVATEFGLNALHGGNDSRAVPGAQSAREVAEVIADAIESRAVDVYTRPAYREMIARYYAAEDLAAVEALPPFAPAPR